MFKKTAEQQFESEKEELSKSPFADLQNAIETDDYPAFTEALGKIKDINQDDRFLHGNKRIALFFYSPLALAALRRRTDMVRDLLKKGANPNEQRSANVEKQSVLVALYKHGFIESKDDYENGFIESKDYAEIFNLLLNYKDRFGGDFWGDLAPVVSRRLHDLAGVYLQRKADPNQIVNVCGYRALHLAARFGDVEMVQLLVNAGADISLETTEGAQQTPFDVAKQYGQFEPVVVEEEKGFASVQKEPKDSEEALKASEEALRVTIAKVLDCSVDKIKIEISAQKGPTGDSVIEESSEQSGGEFAQVDSGRDPARLQALLTVKPLLEEEKDEQGIDPAQLSNSMQSFLQQNDSDKNSDAKSSSRVCGIDISVCSVM